MRPGRDLGRVAVALLVVTVAAGCSSAGGDDGSAHAAATPHATAGVQDVPEVGTCWDVPADRAMESRYWNDDSSPVPCTDDHTTETVFAKAVDEIDAEAAIALYGRYCAIEANRYAGSDDLHWIPVYPALYLPSEAQVASGQSWVRCDVMLPTGPLAGQVRRLAITLADAATEARPVVWACLDSLEPWDQETSWTPCSRPHAYEASGRLLFVVNVSQRPSARRLAAEAEACADDSRDGEGVTSEAVWDSDVHDEQLNGSCWLHRRDGGPLPAMG